MASAKVEITHNSETWDVMITPPSNPDDLWPDYVKKPNWERGREITIRPESLKFRVIFSELTRQVVLSGHRVLKSGNLGQAESVRLILAGQMSVHLDRPAPEWVAAEVTRAMEQHGMYWPFGKIDVAVAKGEARDLMRAYGDGRDFSGRVAIVEQMMALIDRLAQR